MPICPRDRDFFTISRSTRLLRLLVSGSGSRTARSSSGRPSRGRSRSRDHVGDSFSPSSLPTGARAAPRSGPADLATEGWRTTALRARIWLHPSQGPWRRQLPRVDVIARGRSGRGMAAFSSPMPPEAAWESCARSIQDLGCRLKTCRPEHFPRAQHGLEQVPPLRR